jgi:hypothetical protein
VRPARQSDYFQCPRDALPCRAAHAPPPALSPSSPRSGPTATKPPRQGWRPSKAALAWGAAGLAAVLVLALGLALGLPSGSSSGDSSVTVTGGAAPSCAAAAAGAPGALPRPTRYDVELRFEATHFVVELDAPRGGAPESFLAATSVAFELPEPAGCVVLHADGLNFTRAVLRIPAAAGAAGAEEEVELCTGADACAAAVAPLALADPANSAQTNLVGVDLAGRVLPAGARPILEFEYAAPFGAATNASGVHRSAPFAECAPGRGCAPRALVTSQLERLGARRVFPARDTPADKAVFRLTVVAPAAEAPVVLGNMPQAARNEDEVSGLSTIVFEETPPMSPYLLALAAGRLEEAPGGGPVAGAGGEEGLEVRAWAVPGRELEMGEALRLARLAAPYYEDYLAYTLPIPKLDLVAVPGRAGAMENWGLILLDERRALVNASAAGAYDYAEAASVVCHEVGHQWVGDLATVGVWEDLYFQEGLVSALEYGCMEAAAPGLEADVLKLRVVPPADNPGSPHDGPLYRALELAADPLAPPARPKSDFALGAPGAEAATYAKPAAWMLMLEEYVDAAYGYLRDTSGTAGAAAAAAAAAGFSPSRGMWQDAVRATVRGGALGTATVFDLFGGLADAVAAGLAAAGPGLGPAALVPANNFVTKMRGVVAAEGDDAALRALGADGDGNSPGAWAYSAGYPLLRVDLPELVTPDNYFQTLVNIGTNQSRFCSWGGGADARAWGASDATAAAVEAACASPVRFSTTLALDNLTDCALGGARAPGAGSLTTDVGAWENGTLAAERWVANLDGVRLWRTRYAPQHLANLLEEVAILEGCEGAAAALSPTGGEGACCADRSDVAEAASLLSDAIALALTGDYPGDAALEAVAAAGFAPVTSTPVGRYLLLLPAAEALQRLRPLVQERPKCAARLDRLRAEMLAPHVAPLLAAVGKPAEAGAGPEARADLLQRLAAAPLLRLAALNPSDAGGGGAAAVAPAAAPGGRRRLAQADADVAPAPAPAPAPAADAPAAAPAAPAEAAAALNADAQRRLCALLPGTPVFADFVVNASAPGDSAAAAAAAAAPPVSPDLLPAVYAAAAAMAPACAAEVAPLLEGTAALAAAPGGEAGWAVRAALLRCWLFSPAAAEAERCLLSLPYSAGAGDGSTALRVLALASALEPPPEAPLALRARFAERRHITRELRPALVATAARQGADAWIGIASYLGNAATFAPASDCAVLDLMLPATTAAERAQLEELLDSTAAACPEEVRVRARGRAAQRAAVAGPAGDSMCAWLEARYP